MGARAWTTTAAWICLAGAGWRLTAPELAAGAGTTLVLASLLCAAAGLLSALRGRIRGAALGLFVAAALLGASRLPPPRAPCAPEARPVTVEAILLGWTPVRGGRLRVRLAPDAHAARAWNCAPLWRAEGRWESGSPPRVGDRILVEGLLGGSTDHPWLSLARLRAAGGGEFRPHLLLRQWVRERLSARLPEDAAGIARALLLSDWEGLPAPLHESYRRLGILHLLAVSGMHFWLWDAMLRRSRLARLPRLRWPILILLGGLAGAGPAVLRALVALLLRDAAAQTGRNVNGLRLWSTALLLECAFGAPSRQGLGFVLSYAATGCLLAAPAPRADPPWLGALHASAAATCGSLPVLHGLRGTLEAWSVLATPICALGLPLRLLCSVLALLPGLSALAACGFGALDGVERLLLSALDRLPGTPLARPEWSALRVFAGALCVLLALRLRRVRSRLPILCGGLAAALFLAPTASSDPGGFALLPVGHGLGAVVRGGTTTLLYDLGSRGRDPADLIDRVALPELRRLGWPSPSLAVLSHADADHAAGLALLDARDGLRRLEVAAGEELRLEGMFPCSVRVLGTRAAVSGVRNAEGPVLELRFLRAAGEIERVVVLGDQFGHALRELRARLDPGPIAVLVLPHHGLTTDGLGELLDHLQPLAAWASCGAEDLPLPAAALCARRGIPLCTTAEGMLLWRPTPRHPADAGPSF